jgi:hypothetical protein
VLVWVLVYVLSAQTHARCVRKTGLEKVRVERCRTGVGVGAGAGGDDGDAQIWNANAG